MTTTLNEFFTSCPNMVLTPLSSVDMVKFLREANEGIMDGYGNVIREANSALDVVTMPGQGKSVIWSHFHKTFALVPDDLSDVLFFDPLLVLGSQSPETVAYVVGNLSQEARDYLEACNII